jgi:signal transduction histidine kinase
MRQALALEQEARAAAESANRSKDEFLAVLSHELRSPLGAIVTWVSLIRGGHLDPSRQHRGLEAIERNARLQIKLIEDLLDISRIVSGKMSLELGPVDATTLVETALESVRPLAEVKQIELVTAIDPDLGAFSADGMRLQQVLWNLLSNAVKFTPPRAG